jgi:hypothetical protein
LPDARALEKLLEVAGRHRLVGVDAGEYLDESPSSVPIWTTRSFAVSFLDHEDA